MASMMGDKHRSKPWGARVKVLGVSHFLGYYATQEEAVAAEDAFKPEAEEMRQQQFNYETLAGPQ